VESEDRSPTISTRCSVRLTRRASNLSRKTGAHLAFTSGRPARGLSPKCEAAPSHYGRTSPPTRSTAPAAPLARHNCPHPPCSFSKKVDLWRMMGYKGQRYARPVAFIRRLARKAGDPQSPAFRLSAYLILLRYAREKCVLRNCGYDRARKTERSVQTARGPRSEPRNKSVSGCLCYIIPRIEQSWLGQM
jgi:hypothetical protein